MADITRLKVQLNNTGLQQKDQPLFQLLSQLIDGLNSVSDITASNIITPIVGPQGPPGVPIFISSSDGDGGNDDSFIYPTSGSGSVGPPGPTGPTGPAGVPGPVIFGIDSNEFDGAEFIVAGVPGPAGANGAASPWTLISTTTLTGAATFDLVGLGTSYDEFLFIFIQITFTAVADANIRYSTDNGVTFNSTSGNYRQVAGSGAKSDQTSLKVWGASLTTARDAFFHIHCIREAVPKYCHANFYTIDNIHFQYINDTTTGINAFRILQNAATTFSGGTLYLLGR